MKIRQRSRGQALGMVAAVLLTLGCSKQTTTEPAQPAGPHVAPPVEAAPSSREPSNAAASAEETSARVAAERGSLAPQSFPNAQLYAFECENGRQLFVRADEGFAYLLTEDYDALPRVPGAGAPTYDLGDARISIDGEFAILELDDGQELACKNDAELATWEVARLRGVTFRGVGETPRFVLEMDADSVRLITDDGSRRLSFAKPKPEVRGGKTIYRGSAEQKDVTVTIEEGNCHDSATQRDFGSRVRVDVASSTYQGCGRSLQ